MKKAPEAFRTISEVSEILETPAHVLRFWESKFYQIRPVKRAGGRRYYRPDDVALINGIRTLLQEQGMTIRGVQRVLQEEGIKHVARLGGTVQLGDPDEVDAATIDAVAQSSESALSADPTDAPESGEPAPDGHDTFEAGREVSAPVEQEVEDAVHSDEDGAAPQTPPPSPLETPVQPAPAEFANAPEPTEPEAAESALFEGDTVPDPGSGMGPEYAAEHASERAPEPVPNEAAAAMEAPGGETVEPAGELESDVMHPTESPPPNATVPAAPVYDESAASGARASRDATPASTPAPALDLRLAKRLRNLPRNALGPRRDSVVIMARRIDTLLDRMSEASGAGRW